MGCVVVSPALRNSWEGRKGEIPEEDPHTFGRVPMINGTKSERCKERHEMNACERTPCAGMDSGPSPWANRLRSQGKHHKATMNYVRMALPPCRMGFFTSFGDGAPDPGQSLRAKSHSPAPSSAPHHPFFSPFSVVPFFLYFGDVSYTLSSCLCGRRRGAGGTWGAWAAGEVGRPGPWRGALAERAPLGSRSRRALVARLVRRAYRDPA